MPRISRKLSTAAAILATGIGIFVILKLSGPVQQPVESRERVWRVDTLIAQPKQLSPTLTLYGRVETPELLRAAAPADGRVAAVEVREGQRIEPGQLLLSMDPRDFVPRVRQAQADVDDLQAQLKREQLQHAANQDALAHERELLELAESALKRARDLPLDPDERTGWSVYDFTTGEKLVTINEDEQFQAASLVKPFIAAAFFYKVEKGELSYNRESRRQMERMIQHSNNASTNWVTRKVGGPQAVQRILKQQYPAIFQEIHLVEYIPAGGKTYRNKASVHDYSRFLYALWKENIAGAREIKRLMALPGSDRIYTGVRVVPKGTKVYNKTGSTARVCGDMGILNIKGPDGKWYPYTVIGIIEKEQNATNYTSWIRSRGNIIRHVSSIVYQSIAQNHNI